MQYNNNYLFNNRSSTAFNGAAYPTHTISTLAMFEMLGRGMPCIASGSSSSSEEQTIMTLEPSVE